MKMMTLVDNDILQKLNSPQLAQLNWLNWCTISNPVKEALCCLAFEI